MASNEAAAQLDYLEDLYRDWNDDGASSGGAAERISAEFERIRRELGGAARRGLVVRPAADDAAASDQDAAPRGAERLRGQPATALCP
ncbi:hypothetical protein GCM10010306_099040 [Streptomyces umbrinus]|nr:hypothetical protein GCM10010306_099040 [Streptomyces umbrinus]